jgi:hypothetical protein
MFNVHKRFKNLKVYLPISKYMIAWYTLVMFIVITDFYFAVLYVCFDSELSHRIILYVYQPLLFVIFIADILVTFNTSFIRNGELITDKRTIKTNYIKSIYFVFDLLALICVVYQISMHSSNNG